MSGRRATPTAGKRARRRQGERKAVGRVWALGGVDAEHRFIAALIADALEECQAGCPEAAEWLRWRGLDWLALIAPDDVPIEALAGRLAAATAGAQLGLGIEALAAEGAAG